MSMTAAGEMTARIDVEHVDGRTLRRNRNRTAVIVALLDIVREGNLHPGASEIADRAGVSHRSIFRYFDDLADLARTAIDHAFAAAQPFAQIPDIGQGSRSERIASLVDARLALFEHVDGPMQLARMRAPLIPSIDEGIAEVAQLFRSQIAEHFATELDTVADEERRAMLVDALLVLNSYDSYTIHVRLLGDGVERIRAAWTVALDALLS